MSDLKHAIGAIEDMMLAVHDASMSDNPYEACEGRLAKRLVPFIESWIEDEMQRASTPADASAIILAAVSGGVSLMFTAALNVVPTPEKRADVLKHMRDYLIDRYDANSNAMSKHQRQEPV